jgi:hypothetical protein
MAPEHYSNTLHLEVFRGRLALIDDQPWAVNLSNRRHRRHLRRLKLPELRRTEVDGPALPPVPVTTPTTPNAASVATWQATRWNVAASWQTPAMPPKRKRGPCRDQSCV